MEVDKIAKGKGFFCYLCDVLLAKFLPLRGMFLATNDTSRMAGEKRTQETISLNM
jgi:hypothetical protein